VTKDNYETMRRAMVSNQLRTTAVSDTRVVQAMQDVPREAFVPAERQALAYVDVQIPLNSGRALNTPMATGRLLTEAQLRPDDNVLLIGAATGYCAALLSKLVAQVTAVECDAALAGAAQLALDGDSRVTITEGPLQAGAAGHAPYDVLMIDGAVPAIPQALIDQLADGARVVSGTIENGVTRLSQGRKIGGHVRMVSIVDADCALLPGFDQPKSFVF
jgi:protein-L-isoaspartate(D-aspartate) O-methyltransferase